MEPVDTAISPEETQRLHHLVHRIGGDPTNVHHQLRAALHEIQNLQAAIHTRTIIGQATGIVMERHDLTASDAFDVICRLSQESDRKVFNIAEHIVKREP